MGDDDGEDVVDGNDVVDDVDCGGEDDGDDGDGRVTHIRISG